MARAWGTAIIDCFSRRIFIKSTLVGGVGLSALRFDLTPVYAQSQSLKISRASETRSTGVNIWNDMYGLFDNRST